MRLINNRKDFIERLLILSLFVIVLATLWSLRHLLVMALAAMIVAVLLRAISDPLMHIPGLGLRGSLFVTLLLVIGLLGGLGWIFGQQVGDQFSQLGDRVPAAWEGLEQHIVALPGGKEILASLSRQINDARSIAENVGHVLWMAGDALTGLFLIIVGAIFFAAQPKLYRMGALKLVPESRRALAQQALVDSGRALKLFMLGQLISMVLVGILTGLGLWWAGVPSPIALGIIAGLTEGLPYLGPILAAIPGLLLALSESPQTALWALVVYVVVQQVEGNTILPVIHRQTVSLPPALTLFALIAGGTLFGLIGLIFAAPLLVIVYVLVKRLYVRETLDTPTPMPGEQ